MNWPDLEENYIWSRFVRKIHEIIACIVSLNTPQLFLYDAVLFALLFSSTVKQGKKKNSKRKKKKKTDHRLWAWQFFVGKGASPSTPMLTPTQKYAAGALFALALHQAQIHQTCPLGFPSHQDNDDDRDPSEERSSTSSSAAAVSGDPKLWAHQSSGLLRPVFKY